VKYESAKPLPRTGIGRMSAWGSGFWGGNKKPRVLRLIFLLQIYMVAYGNISALMQAGKSNYIDYSTTMVPQRRMLK